MIRYLLSKSTKVPALLKSLDAGMLRSRVIANNVANVTTPEYKRVEVRFEEALRKALDKNRIKGTMTDSKHIPTGRKDIDRIIPEAYKPVDPTLPSGVNNVDIDMEMSKLAENQLLYNMGVTFLRGAYQKLNAAVQAKSIT
jgi:flagellar basal-body rod protein FlgB